jgi:hypothetical protein
MTVLIGDSNTANYPVATNSYATSNGEMIYSSTVVSSGTVNELFVNIERWNTTANLKLTIRNSAGALLGSGVIVAGATGVRSVSVTPFAVTAGEVVYRGIIPNAGSPIPYQNATQNTVKSDATSTYASTLSTFTLPGTARDTLRQFQVWAEGASGPSINPIGTDVTAYPGQSRTATLQNVVATPNAIAYVYNGSIVSTHTDFDWTAGDDGAGTITYTVAQGNLPYGNTDLVIRVSFDSGDPVTLAGMELTVEPDYQYVVAAGTLVTETEESIWSGYEGDTPVAGYQTHTPEETSDARTITVDPTGTWVVGAGNGSSPNGYSFPVRVWDGADWDSYTVTVDLSGGEPEPGTPTIETVGAVRIGGTIAVTVSGFGDTVNAGTLDGVALTSASDTSITIPALITTATAPRPGTRTLTLTDGADSDNADVLVRAPSGWSYYTIAADFVEAINGVASSFLPDGAAADDFILYPSSKNNVSDSGIGTSFVGTQEFFHLDNATNIATAFDVTTGAGAAAFGGSASGTNKMHAVKMTARKMGN